MPNVLAYRYAHCRLSVIAVLVFACLLTSHALAKLPAGWQGFTADQMATAIQAGEIAPADRSVVAPHLWQAFFAKQSIAESGELWAVDSLLSYLTPGRKAVRASHAPGDDASKAAAFQRNANALLSQMQARALGVKRDAIESFQWMQLASKAAQVAESPGEEVASLWGKWATEVDTGKLPLLDQMRVLRRMTNTRGPAWHVTEPFSVRWTGLVAANESGSYQFTPAPCQHACVQFRVWIDGSLVCQVAPGEEKLENAVELSAGKRASVRVELVYDPARRPAISAVDRHHTNKRQFPQGTLLWAKNGGDAGLVPAAAFSHAGDAGSNEGLIVEYFSGTDFSNLQQTRVEPTVDRIWDQGRPVYLQSKEFAAARSALRSGCLKSVSRLASQPMNEKERASLWSGTLSQFIEGLNVGQREELAAALLEQPELLADASDRSLGGFYFHLCAVPGDTRLDFLKAWSDARRPKKWRIGMFHNGFLGGHSYGQRNYMGLRNLSPYMIKEFHQCLEPFLNQYVAQADGSCDMRLAQIATMAAFLDGSRQWYLDQLRERLGNKKLSGDARATWLVARGFAEEYFSGHDVFMVYPAEALPYLEDAMQFAKSAELQFTVLNEMVTRQISLGMMEQAAAAIKQHGERFQAAEHLAGIKAWRTEMVAMKEKIAERSKELLAVQQKRSANSHRKKLTARLERAEKAGNQALVARYRKLLGSE